MSSTNNDSDDEDARVHSSGMSSPGQVRRYELSKSELRKNNKPIMEKKRRARINQCLNELKTLILDALKKDPARHTKLEKADILEMTVRHLQSLHSSRQTPVVATPAVNAPQPVDPSSIVVQKFQTGYQECAGEVNRFVGRLDGINDDIKKRLMAHLDSCVAKMRYAVPATASLYHQHHHNPRLDAITAAALAPNCSSRLLPTGELALILPTTAAAACRNSAFTSVRQDDITPYVYTDEPVSSTSTSAEDTHGGRNPLDFSLKKTAPAATAKRPLGDIPVNVPSDPSSSSQGGKADKNNMTEGQRPVADRPNVVMRIDSPRDPNMWRPW
ncbi:protein deadpan-like [Adelges cooleyi]|uniref:protein deadpan-like n=1 Tax=Adelges cooleyi TaxID=133065 RepID=UPI00217F6F7A|nr:protein deadpan-like [Adelges cooleyi]